jgi:hypothetical protein
LIKENGISRIRTNKELMDLYREADISQKFEKEDYDG